MRLLILSIGLFLCSEIYGQSTIGGKVISTNGSPIPYVHIGIRGENVGTVSFEDGSFTLQIPEAHQNRNLTFSAVGFQDVDLGINTLTSQSIITLEERSISLGEIVVSNKKIKVESAYRINKVGKVNFADLRKGTEIFVKIKPWAKTFDLSRLDVSIGENTLDEFSVRCNFYAIDAEGLPGDRLTTKSPLITTSLKRGKLRFDLSDIGLVNAGNFYVGIEWIISSRQAALYKAAKVDWTKYGVKPEYAKKYRIEFNSGKRKVIQVKDSNGTIYQELTLSKSDRKEVLATIYKEKKMYFAMSPLASSLIRNQAFGKFGPMAYAPVLEFFGRPIE